MAAGERVDKERAVGQAMVLVVRYLSPEERERIMPVVEVAMTELANALAPEQ